jgi:hypothetical protein
MNKRSLWWVAGGGLVIAVGVVAWSLWPTIDTEAARKQREQHVYDEKIQPDVTPSTDLAADRKRMWRTVPGVGEQSRHFHVSPVSAINAASRVFATVELKGKTPEEVKQLLGVEPRSDYGYHAPFYSDGEGSMVCRFDCGRFGWEFHIVFDGQGKVAEVRRRGIE